MRKSYMIKVLALVIMSFMGWNVFALGDGEVGTPSGCGNHDAGITEPHAGCTQNHTGCPHAKLAQADTKGSTIDTEGEITKNEDSTVPAAEKVTRKVAELDKKSCIKCGLCASVCPEKAITMVHHIPVIDPEKCTGCGICVSKCPTKALALEDHVEKTEETKEAEAPKHNCGNPGVIHHNCPHSQQNNAADNE